MYHHTWLRKILTTLRPSGKWEYSEMLLAHHTSELKSICMQRGTICSQFPALSIEDAEHQNCRWSSSYLCLALTCFCDLTSPEMLFLVEKKWDVLFLEYKGLFTNRLRKDDWKHKIWLTSASAIILSGKGAVQDGSMSIVPYIHWRTPTNVTINCVLVFVLCAVCLLKQGLLRLNYL